MTAANPIDSPPKLPKLALLLVGASLLVLAAVAGVSGGLAHTVAMNLVFLLLGVLVLRQVGLLVLCAFPEARPAPVPQPAAVRVTIIVPAYNEEKVIDNALASLDRIGFDRAEIIVVDDGSTDRTLARIRAFVAAGTRHPMRVLSQANAGKGAALNLALRHAKGDFVLCVDADSRLAPDVIAYALSYFQDPKVGAVGGAVEIADVHGLLARFQALEYAISLNFVRRALSRVSAVTVVPGPIGFFRRAALVSVGGYPERRDAFAEDAELTVRLLGAGWRVKGSLDMVARTQAPPGLFALLRQRYRWKRGLYQAFEASAFALVARPGARGVAIALFLALECFLLDVMHAFVLVFFVSHVIAYWELQPLWVAYAIVVSMDVSVLVFARRSLWRLPADILLLFVQRLTYSGLLQLWGLLALMDEWRSVHMDWDKLERFADSGPGT